MRHLKTGVLASVRSLYEARIALQAGAHIIDLKEPLAGALGAVSAHTVEEVVGYVAGRRPISATIGDLPMDGRRLYDAVCRVADFGPNHIKIGFFRDSGSDWLTCVRTLESCAVRGMSLIAVIFADQSSEVEQLDIFASHGFHGVMLDTASKDTGPLTSHWTTSSLETFVRRVHDLGMICGLAGSLSLAQVPVLKRLEADYLGFRGALCDPSGREGTLRAERIKLVVKSLQRTELASTP
ncbi:MAG: (5-formylfuran-3-yl)methyl phosphate synthase [Thioalkalivibrio sp.]